MTNAEIQVGEYVRFRDGNIRKVVKRNVDNEIILDRLWTFGCGVTWVTKIEEKEDIINHDFNIIKLIEVGDYVKIRAFLGDKEYADDASSYVCFVGETNGKKYIELDRGQDGTEILFDPTLIKTIVTHEQMKAIEYEVSGEDELD